MFETVIRIDGMMCGMCEAHICDAIRSAVPVKKVSAFHGKGQAVVISQQQPDEAALKAAIEKTGYTFLGLESHPYEKKGLFGFGKKR